MLDKYVLFLPGVYGPPDIEESTEASTNPKLAVGGPDKNFLEGVFTFADSAGHASSVDGLEGSSAAEALAQGYNDAIALPSAQQYAPIPYTVTARADEDDQGTKRVTSGVTDGTQKYILDHIVGTNFAEHYKDHTFKNITFESCTFADTGHMEFYNCTVKNCNFHETEEVKFKGDSITGGNTFYYKDVKHPGVQEAGTNKIVFVDESESNKNYDFGKPAAPAEDEHAGMVQGFDGEWRWL